MYEKNDPYLRENCIRKLSQFEAVPPLQYRGRQEVKKVILLQGKNMKN